MTKTNENMKIAKEINIGVQKAVDQAENVSETFAFAVKNCICNTCCRRDDSNNRVARNH